MFKPLTKDNIGHIVDLVLSDLNKRLDNRNITIELSDLAKEYIVENGYEPQYGARPLKRYMQKHVETIAAKEILRGGVGDGETILIDVEADNLVARIK